MNVDLRKALSECEILTNQMFKMLGAGPPLQTANNDDRRTNFGDELSTAALVELFITTDLFNTVVSSLNVVVSSSEIIITVHQLVKHKGYPRSGPCSQNPAGEKRPLINRYIAHCPDNGDR
ncbi:hypothetical protein J6590_015529 [Homalodisca vitripennis]|nr:hypothetical protein J6590_015529 [Homalodisca vitripennis]